MRREQLGMTQSDLGDELSLNKSTIQRYEAGVVAKIKLPIIQAMAQAMDVDPNWLALKTDEMGSFVEVPQDTYFGLLPPPKTKKAPRLGRIACGRPIGAIENFEDYDDVDEDVDCDYTLICEGDSMINARIMDGDIVYIRQQPIVENGEIAAVSIDGETTLKRFYRNGNDIMLVAENPAYPPMTFTLNESNDIIILGKAVAFKSWIK